MIIEIDGIPVEVTKKSIKSFTVRIYPPDGSVKVSAPLKFSDKLIRQYLQEKSNWIQTQRERIKSRPVPHESLLQTGSTVEFQGKHYTVLVTEQHGPSQIKIDKQLLLCYVKPGTSDARKKIMLDNWYRREMESLVPDLIDHWASTVGVNVAEWGVKSMKTRWGSCNTRARRIWLNLSLIKKPLVCLEYVIVHELVHLLEASHNQRFHRLMTQFMPNWREHQIVLEGKRRSKEPSY